MPEILDPNQANNTSAAINQQLRLDYSASPQAETTELANEEASGEEVPEAAIARAKAMLAALDHPSTGSDLEWRLPYRVKPGSSAGPRSKR